MENFNIETLPFKPFITNIDTITSSNVLLPSDILSIKVLHSNNLISNDVVELEKYFYDYNNSVAYSKKLFFIDGKRLFKYDSIEITTVKGIRYKKLLETSTDEALNSIFSSGLMLDDLVVIC